MAVAFGLVLGLVFGRDAEEAALGIDGAELAVLVHVDPGDVVAHRPHAIAGQAARPTMARFVLPDALGMAAAR